MVYTIEFEHGDHATITLWGVGTPEGLRRLDADLADDPRIDEGTTILIDAAEFDIAETDAGDTTAGIDWDLPAAAVAYVAPDDRKDRVAALLRAHVGGGQSRRRVFGSRDEAVAWLAQHQSS